MKPQNKIRMSAVTVGLGVALMLAGTARAQQDMDPTNFDVNPGAPAVKAMPIRTAQTAPVYTENVNSETALSFISGKDITLDGEVTRVAAIEAGIVLILFSGLFLIVRYALAATKRERFTPVRSSSPYTSKVPYTPVSAVPVQ